MFGGAGNGMLLGDTWEYDPTTAWTRRDLPGPSPRFGHGMTAAGAPNISRAPIVFGGFDGQQYLSDLWRFEEPTGGGRGWYRIFPADGVSPPARFNAALAANDTTSKIILFGGTNGATFFGDTWEFDLDRKSVV